jgi:hypothetical protein
MDQEYRDKIRQKAKDVVEKMSLEELSYTLGRYCGQSNQFLSEKKFGFIMPQDIVERELKDRTVEDALFGDTE